MPFHIMHVVPDPRIHGLYGYAEVIETVRWGLAALGHSVTVGVNSCVTDSTNILFGAQTLSVTALSQLPHRTIVCNFEQLSQPRTDAVRPSLHYIAEHFQIWEYSPANLAAWRGLHADCRVKVVPVGWAPTLGRIPKRQIEDIDVLFYGLPRVSRLAAFKDICETSLKCVYACGLYGASRDELISRSKIVLNLNFYDQTRVFEVVRVSYLLANGKAVVSDIYPDSFIEPDMRDAVAFAPPRSLAETCQNLIADDAARAQLAARGQAIIQRRDIRDILKKALEP